MAKGEPRRTVPVINDFCVAEDAHDHRKVRRLRRLLGVSFFEGWWCLTRLWRWCTCRGGPASAWDGFMGSSKDEIEGEADWSGIPGTFLAALVDAGLVDEREGSYWIHDFHESQPHIRKILGKMQASRENGKRGGRPTDNPGEPGDNLDITQENLEEPNPNLEKPSEAESESESESEGEKDIAVVPPAPPPKKPRKPRTKQPPADLTKLRDAWFETFGFENGGKRPSWGPKEAGMLKPKITAHGLADCLERLGNFVEHYKARSFGADALALGSFVTHFDRWASPPRGVETNADVARRVEANVLAALGEDDGPHELPARRGPKELPPAKPCELEDPDSDWFVDLSGRK